MRMRQTTTTHSFLHDGHPQSYNNHEATTLKVNKDSHAILKNKSSTHPYNNNNNSSSSPPYSSSASSLAVAGSAKPPPQRHPVIIYTHSPKVIHTHPKDFMALVQKLTGLSRSDHDPDPARRREEDTRNTSNSNHHNNNNNNNNNDDDNDSSSVITEENGHQQLNSSSSNCFLNNPSSVFESPPPPNPYHRQLPAAAADRLNLYPPFFGYADPLLFGTSPAFRTLDAINDHFPEFS